MRLLRMSRWDPASYEGIVWNWPESVMAKIGSVVRLRKEKVDPKITPFSALHLITIHFDGSVSERKIESSRQYTMDMYWARPRDIVVAKIDLKNGAVSVIPDDWCNVAVTNHFAVYEPDEKLIFPEYLRLIVQVSFFKAYLNRNKVGAEGRKEVKLDFFESIKIPLPPLDVQRAIVQKWEDAQAEIESRIRDIEMLQKSVSSIIQNTLRNNGDEKNVRPKYFACDWSNIGRWGVEMCWQNNHSKPEGNFPTVLIRDICRMGSGGTPSRKVNSYYKGGHIPWVKTSEVVNNEIFDTEEKITELGLKQSSAKLYPVGSLIVAMYGQGATRGRTAKLGVQAATNQACCVLFDFKPIVNSDYLWLYLMSEYENLRQLASGNNQPNLNAEMIASYSVPLPPLELQYELVKQAMEMRQKVEHRKREVDELRFRITSEIEAAIMGENDFCAMYSSLSSEVF